jgi:hypothetical protein
MCCQKAFEASMAEAEAEKIKNATIIAAQGEHEESIRLALYWLESEGDPSPSDAFRVRQARNVLRNTLPGADTSTPKRMRDTLVKLRDEHARPLGLDWMIDAINNALDEGT